MGRMWCEVTQVRGRHRMTAQVEVVQSFLKAKDSHTNSCQI